MAVQVKSQLLSEKVSISVICFLTILQQTFDSSQTHEGAAVWFSREVRNGPAITAVKKRSTLLSNDANRQKDTIESYAGVDYHLLKRYSTDAITTKADDEICNVKQG